MGVSPDAHQQKLYCEAQFEGPKQQLAASKQLANFMRNAITENEGSLWIAQREGRAKDGNDRTEAAVLKMLTLSRDKQSESADDVLGRLNIVPLTVSYELDPCDCRKARELAVGDDYQKRQFEDLESIAAGITGERAESTSVWKAAGRGFSNCRRCRSTNRYTNGGKLSPFSNQCLGLRSSWWW